MNQILISPSKAFIYKDRKFWVDTKEAKQGWRYALDQALVDRGHKQCRVNVMSGDLHEVIIEPGDIHNEIIELFQMRGLDGQQYLTDRGKPVQISELYEPKQRQIPLVKLEGKSRRLYPWHELDNLGGMFIVEGRKPVEVAPLIKAYVAKMAAQGKYHVRSVSVPIGCAIMTVWIEGPDPIHSEYRERSYLTFPRVALPEDFDEE